MLFHFFADRIRIHLHMTLTFTLLSLALDSYLCLTLTHSSLSFCNSVYWDSLLSVVGCVLQSFSLWRGSSQKDPDHQLTFRSCTRDWRLLRRYRTRYVRLLWFRLLPKMQPWEPRASELFISCRNNVFSFRKETRSFSFSTIVKKRPSSSLCACPKQHSSSGWNQVTEEEVRDFPQASQSVLSPSPTFILLYIERTYWMTVDVASTECKGTEFVQTSLLVAVKSYLPEFSCDSFVIQSTDLAMIIMIARIIETPTTSLSPKARPLVRTIYLRVKHINPLVKAINRTLFLHRTRSTRV